MAMNTGGELTPERWVQMLKDSIQQLQVNTENAKIRFAMQKLGDRYLQYFNKNLETKSFFGYKWAQISSDWRKRKRKHGLLSGILEERGRLKQSLKMKMVKQNNFRIYCNPREFEKGPDKRHYRMYPGIHNEGLPGSGGPGKRRKRQFIGEPPFHSKEEKELLGIFASWIMNGLPGGKVL